MLHLYPEVVSYNRFVELEREIAIPLMVFIKKVLLGKCTGISFVDSTPLRVCKNQRIHIHKTFKGIAQIGKCSMGWLFGFKLHLICNEKGELLNFMKAYLWRKIGVPTMTVMVGIYAFVPAGTGLKGGLPTSFPGSAVFFTLFFCGFCKIPSEYACSSIR